jgi:hypothetical protein
VLTTDHLAAASPPVPFASDFLNGLAAEIECDCRPHIVGPERVDRKDFSLTTMLVILEALVSLAINCGLFQSDPAKVVEIAKAPTLYYRLIVRGHVFAATLKRGGWRTEDVGAIVDALLKRARAATVADLAKLRADAFTYRQT